MFAWPPIQSAAPVHPVHNCPVLKICLSRPASPLPHSHNCDIGVCVCVLDRFVQTGGRKQHKGDGRKRLFVYMVSVLGCANEALPAIVQLFVVQPNVSP